MCVCSAVKGEGGDKKGRMCVCVFSSERGNRRQERKNVREKKGEGGRTHMKKLGTMLQNMLLDNSPFTIHSIPGATCNRGLSLPFPFLLMTCVSFRPLHFSPLDQLGWLFWVVAWVPACCAIAVQFHIQSQSQSSFDALFGITVSIHSQYS